MKKKDLYLIISVMLFSVIAFFCIWFFQKDGTQVVITVKGQVYETVSLFEDREIEVKTDQGMNVVIIQDGQVSMKEATCPDQICVKHSKITKTGETIVCLPHQVVIEIIDDQQKEIDSVA